MKKILTILFLGMFLISLASAELNTLSDVRQNECILIPQTCASCSYVNITILRGNETIIDNQAMSKSGATWTYNFCETSELGRYDINGFGDLEGIATGFNSLYFEVKNSNNFIFYTLIGLAILFFVSTLFVSEEFFVYISGVLFLVSGIYVMINGIDVVNDLYSRAISYICIGLGMLFTIGAYIFNSYNREEEEY